MARQRGDATQDRLNATAEQIGTVLGQFATRLEALQKQKDELAADLRRYIASIQPAARPTAGQPARGSRSAADTAQRNREMWKRDRKAMQLAGRGIGKKRTHSKKAIPKPMTERTG